MPQKAEVEAASVVVLGRFNPAIFQPAWFAVQGLITKDEADAAKLGVVHPEIAAFSTSWFSLQVTVTGFQVETSAPDSYPLLSDLTTGVFDILSHTPVTKMGINTRRHYRYDSESDWHRVGHVLAPKEPWEDVLDAPGMIALVMRGNRPDTTANKVEVRVQPESRGQSDFRIVISTNHEYVLTDSESAEHIGKILSREWDGALAYGRSAAEGLLKAGMR